MARAADLEASSWTASVSSAEPELLSLLLAVRVGRELEEAPGEAGQLPGEFRRD